MRGCVPWWLLGAVRGFPWASALIVHQHTKIAPFRLFGAIAFPHSFNKSVLRGFLGGLFGFIGFRCIFGCLVAFVALVRLYACNVRRLRTEKRKRPYFCGLLRSCIFVGCSSCICLYCVCCFDPALCVLCLCWLCGLCCWWFFFPLDDMTKRKGAPLLMLPLFVRGLWVFLYAHKLVQVIPGIVGSKISPAGCGVLYFAGSLSYFSEIAIFHGFACFYYFDFDAAPVTYCERGGWCKSCHIGCWFCGLLLFVCYMFSAAFKASSFDFEKIHPAPQVKCALNLPPMVFKVSLIARVSPITAIAFSE